jgi:hypothetical protein
LNAGIFAFPLQNPPAGYYFCPRKPNYMKMKQSFVLLTAALCMAFTFNACKKGGGDNKPTEQPGKIPGMGENTGTPNGEQFVLPTGISVVGTIKGDDCDTVYQVGSGSLVEVCVAIFNSKQEDVTLVIPAGLIILATDAQEYQHGIVIQETRILLKANKLTRVSLDSYCINATKHASNESAIYTLGPVSNSVLMRELINLLKNKKLEESEYPEYGDYMDVNSDVQDLVWSVSDHDGLDRATLNATLATIPNR